MGEVQEQRYVCKICNKSCVSGKSLGGHMRTHLALISASKKTTKNKAEIKLDDDDQDDSCQLKESSMNQSNSAFLSEENMKNCDSNAEFGDGDQNISYGLRENPKKSWRISDPKHGVSKYWNSCKECGKDFPSLRALSGHMRCHSIKNKQVSQCKKCRKEFDSMKAMFGHMKSHSKKSRVLNDSTDSLSDLENFCPVRRKRSRIGYKNISNTSSDINASNYAVSELGEAEEAATCLIMLSRGVNNCFKSETESSDEYAYYGAESSYRNNKFSGYEGNFLSEKEKKKCLSTRKLDCSSSGCANMFTVKNVCEFDDIDIVAEDPKKVDSEVANDELLSVENVIKVHEVLEVEKSYEFVDCADDSKSSDSTKSAEFNKDFLVAIDETEGSSDFFEFNASKNAISHEYDFEKTSSENGTDLDILKNLEERHKIKSRTCNKTSLAHCLLGGQNARHKMRGNNPAFHMNASLSSVAEADFKLDQLEFGDNQLEQESTSEGAVSLESSKRKGQECPICFKVFPSDQALGGHKMAHYNGLTEGKNQEAMIVDKEVSQVQDMFDLNFPATVNEGYESEVGLDSWWIDRSREHEALVLTN